MISLLFAPIRSSSNAIASSSRVPLLGRSRGAVAAGFEQVRCRSQLAPRRTKYRKAHKGRISIPTGGSISATTLSPQSSFGLRVLQPSRLSAKQLDSALVAIKRSIKVVKGAEAYLRVFPDIPVCVKGNETRMGKGKGGFEYWACRVPVGKVVFEVGGGNIREEVAKEALRLASAKLPILTEFITQASPPRLGHIANDSLISPQDRLLARIAASDAVVQEAAGDFGSDAQSGLDDSAATSASLRDLERSMGSLAVRPTI